MGGRGRLPVLEGDTHRRTGHLLDDIGLRGGNVRGQHGQATRAVEPGQSARGQQPFAVEQLLYALAQLQ